MASLSRFGEPSLPALVLLHGFLGSKSDWLGLMPRLSQHFHCICVDLPGHGDHIKARLPTPGFEVCVDDILSRLDAIGVKQFHLLGYSLGGRIALHLAKKAPTRLLSLTLESSHPGLENPQDKQARHQHDAVWANKLLHLPLSEFLSAWYHQAIFAELTTQERLTLINKRLHNRAQPLHNCYLATSLALQDPLWQVPSSLHCPSYFFAGNHDKKFSDLAKRWQNQAPIELQQFTEAGHNLHLGAPAPFCRTLIRLLTSPSKPHSEH